MTLYPYLVKAKRIIIEHLPIILFLIVFVVGAFTVYKDFGMTWDEQDTYTTGKYYLQHLIGRDTEFFSRDLSAYQHENLLVLYNHSYPGLLYGLNALINRNVQINYYTFHLLNILISSIVFLLAYELIYSKYKKWSYALIAPVFLLLIPRFIGDIPANPRDGSFAIFYFVAVAAIYFLRNKKGKVTLLLLGLLFGLVQNLRILGVTIYVVYFLFDLLNYIQKPKISKLNYLKEITINLIIIGLIGFLVAIVTSPYLGNNFFVNFANSLTYSKSIVNDAGLLIGGHEETISQLGRDYLPRMIAITTPLFISILALLGIYYTFRKKLRNKLLNLFVIALAVNLLLYFITKPVIFDGVRHFLFILPMIGMIATMGLIEFIRQKHSRLVRLGSVLLLGLNIILVLLQYAQIYPYIYIYYNETVGYLTGAYQNYETDYWGASFKESVEWLSKNEIKNDRKYLVATCGNAVQSSYYFPANVQWAKYIYEADYFICYSRNYSNLQVDQSKLIHTINRDGIPLNFIYKLK